MTAQLRGVCAAVLTPLDAELRPDTAAAIEYYRSLLDSGCDSLNVLGTSGESFSLSVDDRLRLMEALAGSGLPCERMMVGTGATALADAIRLTRAAFRLGFSGALIMPPTFFRGVSDRGVMHFFEHFFEGVHPPERGILLYNYPAMSGIAFHPDLVDRLIELFPGIIGGVKDSSNDPQLQRELYRRHPELLVYPSSESFLSEARNAKYAGCISGTVALWPQLAARVWRGDAAAQPELTRKRESFSGLPLIPAVRYLLAQRTGDPDWERCVPPLEALTQEQVFMLNALKPGRPL